MSRCRSETQLGIPAAGGSGAGRRRLRGGVGGAVAEPRVARRLPGRQPARALGAAAGLAACARAGGARRPAWRGRCGGRAQRAALARPATPGCAGWSGSTRCRISRCARSATACRAAARDPATRSLWRRHQERLARALHELRVGPPRSDLPRRDPWALRAALLLLLLVALVEAGGMAPQAPAPGVRAATAPAARPRSRSS